MVPVLLVVASEGRIENEEQVVTEMEKQGFEVSVFRRTDDVRLAMTCAREQPCILIVDAESVMREDTASYESFLHDLSKLPSRSNLRTWVIMPTREASQPFVGLGRVVERYLTLPLTPSDLLLLLSCSGTVHPEEDVVI